MGDACVDLGDITDDPWTTYPHHYKPMGHPWTPTRSPWGPHGEPMEPGGWPMDEPWMSLR